MKHYCSTLLIAVTLLISLRDVTGQTYGPSKQLCVAFLYPTAINDFGFTYANEIARVTIERELLRNGYNVRTTFYHSVAPVNASEVMESSIADGYELIVAAGGQFAASVQQVAVKYPNIRFISTAGVVAKENVAIGFHRNWEASYLLGYMCALSSRTQKVGFVAAFHNNNVHTRAINAFYIGAKAARSNISFTLASVNSFLDSITERKATAFLVDAGVDCIASMVNDNAVNTIANQRNTFSVGYASDARLTSGEYVLSSVIFNWAPYFRYWIQRAYNGTWVPNESVMWGFSEGALDVAPWGSKLDANIRAIMDSQVEQMTLTRNFNPFCGEYATKWNSNGSCLSNSQIQSMRELVDGVEFRFNLTLDSVLVREYVAYSSAAAIFAVVLAIIFLILMVISLTDLIIYRNTVVYRTSSPLFCAFIGLGIAAIYVSIFGWIGVPTTALCAMRTWLAGIGFSFVYACILAKNWRVFRIFTDDSLRVFAITNFDLLSKFVVPVLGVELIILILWQSLDPLRPVEIVSPIADDTRLLFCASQGSTFLAISLIYKGILLLLASGLSYLTRRITSDYRESTLIALAVYNTIIIGVIMILVNIIAGASVLIQYVISVFGVLLIASVTHALVFFPKFWNIHVNGNKKTWTSAVGPNGSTTNSSGRASIAEAFRNGTAGNGTVPGQNSMKTHHPASGVADLSSDDESTASS